MRLRPVVLAGAGMSREYGVRFDLQQAAAAEVCLEAESIGKLLLGQETDGGFFYL